MRTNENASDKITKRKIKFALYCFTGRVAHIMRICILIRETVTRLKIMQLNAQYLGKKSQKYSCIAFS